MLCSRLLLPLLTAQRSEIPAACWSRLESLFHQPLVLLVRQKNVKQNRRNPIRETPFRLFLFAIVLALLLLCSLWKKRHSLFCAGWSTQSNHRVPSEGDSTGSCYAPPHYSRCSSFYHAPPPYQVCDFNHPLLNLNFFFFFSRRWLLSPIYIRSCSATQTMAPRTGTTVPTI